MNITTVGIDLAKNVFSLHGVDANGKAVLRLRRSSITWRSIAVFPLRHRRKR